MTTQKHPILKLALSAFCLLAVVTIYAAPGELDLTFGNGGRIPSPSGSSTLSGAFDVAVQPDGRILAAGTEQDFTAQTPNGPAGLVLTRYLPNGSPDLTFGQGGKVVTHLSATCHSYGDDLLLQTDGKIVVTTRIDGCGSDTGAYVLRFLPDGTLDSSFAVNGKMMIGSVLSACRLAIHSDENLLVGCSGRVWNEDAFTEIIRLTSNGSLDPTFDGDGRVVLAYGYGGSGDIAVQSDGRIVAASTAYVSNSRNIVLTRLNTDGSLDASFGDAGGVFTSVGDVTDITVQPDNKIVAVGYYEVSPTNVGGLMVRYLPNGALDTTFGTSGFFFSSPGRRYSVVEIQSNGKVIVGDSDYRVTRFLQSGAPDPTFGANGQMLVSFPNPAPPDDNGTGGISGIAIQGDGRIVTAGYWQASDPWPDVNLLFRFQAIARLLGDLSVSNNATIAGRVLTPAGLGLRNAVVVLTDYDGTRRTVLTSSLGYYSFNDILAGETYTVSVQSKRFRFEPKTLLINDNLTDVNFVGHE